MHVINVYNRSEKAFEFVFDGMIYKAEPEKVTPMSEHAARHGFHRSVFGVDIYGGGGDHVLALEGDDNYEKPLQTKAKEKVGRFVDQKVVEQVEGIKFTDRSFRNVQKDE